MEPTPGVEARPSRRGLMAVAYVAVLAAGLVVLRFVLTAGSHLHAPKPVVAKGVQAVAGASADKVIWHLLLASAVIIVAARLVGALFQRINQPQVVGEITAGVLLGPSVLGALAPSATTFLFPKTALPFIDALSQIGLVFFMFLIGLELDVRLIRGRGQAAATVSQVSIVMPFLLGGALALVLFPKLGSASGRFTPFALFMGASMSITAFPVLARILTERGLYKSPLGAVSLTCAAVDDVSAWCLLAIVVAVARSNGPAGSLRTAALSVVFVAFMLLVVRPVVARIASYHEAQGQLGGAMLAMLFVGVLLSALATDRIGIHAIFGAFLFGAIMPQRSELIAEVTGKLEDFTVVFLLPLFFAYNGLRTDLGLLGRSPVMWLYCGLILLVAVAGKWGGSAVTAKAMGLPWRESLALGVLMNTRGLTELIILNIGLDLGVIPPTLFAMLVVMALATTFMTTPLLSVIYPGGELEAMAVEEDGDGVRRFRILVPAASVAQARSLAQTAVRLARDEDERADITLLRVVRLPGSAYRVNPRVVERRMQRATDALKPVVSMIEAAGHTAVPLVVPGGDVADVIVRAANERQPDLVLLGWHRSLWRSRILGGAVGEVLRRAKADVAVMVDPAGAEPAIHQGGRIVVPFGGGFHEDVGYDLAVRLADSTDATVTLLGPDEDRGAEELGNRAAKAYEDAGVWATPVPVPPDEASDAVVEHAQDADLVVLGVGDEWARNNWSLGGLRERVAARSTAPILLVRKHGQKRRNRAKEWIVDTGETEVLDAAAPAAPAAPAGSRRTPA